MIEEFEKAVSLAKVLDLKRKSVFDDVNGTIYLAGEAGGEYWLYKWLPGQGVFRTIRMLEEQAIRFTNGKNLVNL